MDAKDLRFPMLCPVCHDVSGAPFRVSVGDDKLAIDLRCNSCHHEWMISVNSPPLMLTPKADRRSSDKSAV